MILVPILPSVDDRAPNRPLGCHVSDSGFGPLCPNKPAPANFSTPTAIPTSVSPALTAIMATLKAVAPVAQALETLNTGIPVCPICFCNCWPIPAPAFIRFPTPSTPTSEREIPASFSASRLASAARSTTSLSGCLPNLVILDPIIQIVSDPIFSSYLYWFKAESYCFRTFTIFSHRIRHQLNLHPQSHIFR